MAYARCLISVALTCAVMSTASAALAAFPDRPVHFICTSVPGGGIDTVARQMAARLSEKWHQPVLVENRPGSDTMVGEGYVAHAQPDGYTILINNAQRTLNAARGNADAGYDMVNSFAAVTQVGTQPQILVANAEKLKVKTLAEMVTLAKAQPNKLTYGDYGRGSANDLGMKLLMQKTGTEIFEIPYKTQAEGMVGLLGGEVDMVMGSLLTVGPQVKSGKLTALAVTDDARSPAYPDVPTVAESLHVPSFQLNSWYGIFAPAATPKDIIAKLNEDFVSVIRSPEVQDPLTRDGFKIVANSPEQFEQAIKEEITMWKGVMSSVPAK